jgi:hypothetical protein
VNYYAVEPEVAGGFGENTKVIQHQARPFTVERLHYDFAGWLGDELLESTPCFIVSSALAEDLESARLTGFSLDDVEVSVSKQFADQKDRSIFPAFRWLKIEGTAGVDDFGLDGELTLVVSERALEVLTSRIAHACVRPVANARHEGEL